jgi:signal peptidase I
VRVWLPRRRLPRLLFFVVMVLLAFFFVLGVTSVPYGMTSSAMELTLHCGGPGSGCEADQKDRVLVSRFTYRFREPRRGDIAAFHAPDTAAVACGLVGNEDVVYLKRIVALPGERWREQNGFIYVNGKRLDEPYVMRERRDRETIPERRIPEGQYLLLGDNRVTSCDSRRWGTVPRHDLIGPVYAVYWPPGRMGFN